MAGGKWGIEGLALSPVAAIKARVSKEPRADGQRDAVRISFDKTDPSRRLVALETPLRRIPVGARAVVLRYRLSVHTAPEACRLALIIFEKGGGVWYKLGQPIAPSATFTDARLSLASLQQAAFSQDESGSLQWEKVDRVLVGLVIDGKARGAFSISAAFFTDKPYVPTQPLLITAGGPGKWSIAKDPAVRAAITTPNEGPNGKPCAKLRFHFPGRRHMYFTPYVPVPDFDLEGYKALSFTYKATLPPGIKGLLVILNEHDGSAYEAVPYPAPTAQWKAITIPFTSFKLGGWSRDENGKLDIETVNRIVIGAHGTASGDGGDGTIWVTDIKFTP